MSELSIASVSLRSTEPVSGVSLEGYVKCLKNGQILHSFPEEEITESTAADPTSRLAVRYRWLRSPDTVESGKGHVCHIHPERPGSYYCGFWKSEYSSYGYPFSDACHCSLDCFQRNWKLQMTYWEKAQAAKYQATEGGGATAPGLRPAAPNGESTWTVVGTKRCYTPNKLDVGHRMQLRISVVNLSTKEEVEDSSKVVTSAAVRRVCEPMPRRMVPLEPAAPAHIQKSRFTVLTYNILADLYTTTKQFPSSEAFALHWQYRKQIILKELALYDADIVCLQEVQSTSFNEDLKPEMDERGFDAVFKKKTQEDMMMDGGRYAMDGCATFYRRGRFTLVKKYEVEFNKAAQSFMDGGGTDDGGDRRRNVNRLMKPNVALILVLEGVEQSPGRRGESSDRALVCVANTHIHANHELADVKLWQVHTLLKGLEKIANSANIPMVVAGDLNSMPGSAPHTLMLQRHVASTHKDLDMDPLNLFSGPASTNKLSHSLRLRSAYAAAAECTMQSPELRTLRARLDGVHHEPQYTNVTHDFKETLDYLVCSSPELQPTALLELPELSDMIGDDAAAGLPNARWPSDHIALMAEFQFDFMVARGSA